jgi:hypothetical protein
MPRFRSSFLGVAAAVVLTPYVALADVRFHPAEPRQLRISLGWGL